MESRFIINALDIVTNKMRSYYRIYKEISRWDRKAKKDEIDAMIKCRIAIKESLDFLKTLAGHTIINEEKQNKFKKLESNMKRLTDALKSDKEEKKDKQEEAFSQVETSYRDTLHALRTAALEAIKQEHQMTR